jgi:hypothetical protein
MDATKREKVINHLLRNDLRQSIRDASENVISIFSQKCMALGKVTLKCYDCAGEKSE